MNEENKTKQDIIDEILNLEERYYKLYKLNIKFKELFGKSLRHAKELRLVRKQIKELNKKLSELNNESQNKIKNPLYNGQIIIIDYKYKVKTYQLFHELDIEEDSKRRLQIINELKHIYSELLKDIDKKDKNNIKNVLIYLNELLKKEHHKLENFKKSVNIEPVKFNYKEDNEEDEVKINELICEDILLGKGTSMYCLFEVMETFKNILQDGQINSNLIKCAKDIVDRLILESKEDEFYVNYVYSIIDAAKRRKNSFSKIDKEKYKTLKEIEKILKNHQELIDVKETCLKDELMKYKFNMVEALLQDENNYPLLKKLTIEYPDIINASKNGKHIIEYILELYLSNVQKLLNKNMKKYINIEYLKEVYFLFTKNPNLRISEDVKDKINKQTYLFIRRLTSDRNLKQVFIDDNIYDSIFVKNEKKMKNIIKAVKSLSSHYYDQSKPLYELKGLNEAQLENQIYYISNSDSNSRNRRDEIDLTDENHIILNDKYTAYNFKRCSDSNILKISVCNFSNLIPENTSIDSYIYNQMLEGNRLDQRILDKLKFIEGEKISAITFKISLDKNNRPISLYIYKSKIIPKNINEAEEMYNDMKKTIDGISKRRNYELLLADNQKIQEVSKRILNELYLDLAKRKKVPFTYSGVEKLDDIAPNIYSKVGSISSKLTNDQFTSIYSAIINNIGEFHYSDKIFLTDGDFDMNLIGEPNYILLLNQRIIKSLILNELDLNEIQYNKRKHILNNEHQNMIIDLNDSIEYKSVDDFKYKKKKKKILIPTGY